jgi:DNA helicase-2/ATP-dependent DNA helicase PcrA
VGEAPPELDDEQRAAVEARDRAIAVLAGPGSGKTRVLSYRTRYLLSEDRTSKALLLTFTNKAAAEMKSRALDVAVVTTDRIAASTYHTFSLRLLQAHGNLLGLSPEFELADDTERKALIQEAMRVARTRDRSNRWSYLRVRRFTPREEEVVRFGEAYQGLKAAENLLDFDDLIVLAADLLEANSEVAEAIAGAHPHILVDEFQDTNPGQFAIVSALSEYAKTISVFADDDQGIYQFAGAEPGNIRRFIEELRAQRFPLMTNYRCLSAIVEKANKLILVDPEASGRQMRPFYKGGEVRSRVFSNTEREAETLTSEVEAMIHDGVEPSQIAFLSRRRTRLSDILSALEARGIPVSNWLGDAYAAHERKALATCLYVVRGSLSPRQVGRLCDLLQVDAIEESDPAVLLESLGTDACLKLLELRDLAWAGAPVLDVVEKAQEALVFVDADAAENMQAVQNAIEAFQAHDAEFGIEHLLAELALGGTGGAPTSGGGVKVSSLHRTKGLQWPYVYLVGLEDNVLPDYHADTPSALSEERRTCFVGICRAERSLTLTRVRLANGFVQRPSQFLPELGFRPDDDT